MAWAIALTSPHREQTPISNVTCAKSAMARELVHRLHPVQTRKVSVRPMHRARVIKTVSAMGKPAVDCGWMEPNVSRHNAHRALKQANAFATAPVHVVNRKPSLVILMYAVQTPV